MRRIGRTALVAVAAAFFVVSPASAQSSSPDFGITAGLNLSTLSGAEQNSASRSYRPGFMGGGSVIFPLNEMTGLQAELLYSQQGVNLSDNGFEGSIKLSYISIPVLVRFALGDPKASTRPAVYIGPYVAFKTGCSVEGKTANFSASSDCSSSGTDIPVKSSDFGATFGGAVDFGALGVFARYSLGLISIDNSGTNSEDIKNRFFTLGGRWSFRAR